MSFLGIHTRNPKPLKSIWCLVCVFFMLASSAQPAYSSHKLFPNAFLPGSQSTEDEDMRLTKTLHNSSLAQEHHVEHRSHSRCNNLGCDDMADCSGQCTISTCCSFLSAYGTYSYQVLTDHLREIIHRQIDDPSVITSHPERLFRPPIR